MGVKKCSKCRKRIELRTECEEEGSVYHAHCFRCCSCHRFLSEYDVVAREGNLFCRYHGKFAEGVQPYCKVYFNDCRTCYRLIFASDKDGGKGEDEEEGGEE